MTESKSDIGPGGRASVTGSDSVLRSPASMLRAASVAIVGASERARWASQIYGNLRQFGYGGRIVLINPRQATVYGEPCAPSLREVAEPVDHAIVIVPAPNVADCADRRRSGRRQIGDRLCGGGRRRRQRGLARARRLAEGLPRHQQVAGRRPELHGLVLLSRTAVRLSQHRAVQRAAGSRRGAVPVRRHAAVLAEKRRRPRLAFLLCGVVGQRGRSRSRRLSRLRGGRSAYPTDRAVHRGYPASGRLHARRRARLGGRQAGARDQVRRHAEIARRGGLAYRRDRRRLCGLSGHVRALRHRQLPLAGRSRRDHAGVPVRPRAERPAHRFCHHVGRHGRSVVRLRRGRGRGGPRVQRRHQRGAAAAHAGRHHAEESARRRHSDDAESGSGSMRDRGPRSGHRYRCLGVAAARQRRHVERQPRTGRRCWPQPTSRSSPSAA